MLAPNGNVIGYTDSVMGQWGLGYDNMNRISSGQVLAGPYAGLNFAWAIDPWGNRKSQTVTGSSQQPIANTPTLTFNASTNRADNWSYDAAGNLLVDQQNNSYSYDAEGRLCAREIVDRGQEKWLAKSARMEPR